MGLPLPKTALSKDNIARNLPKVKQFAGPPLFFDEFFLKTRNTTILFGFFLKKMTLYFVGAEVKNRA
jgi:hypothetical protein